MRTYFPTKNNIGVRNMRTSVTLGGYAGPERGTGAILPRATNHPVNLGFLGDVTPVPIFVQATPALQLPSSSAVSAQQTPTPQVTVPPAPGPSVIYITSGGGTTSALTTTPAVEPTGLTDEVASWLGGTTALGSYNIPNALLTAAVVLGFALLSSSGGGTKRK
jgi:hypothetical protein